LDAVDAADNKKLQLAALMQKAVENNKTKKELQDDKQANDKPLNDSKVSKNGAQERLYEAQAKTIPIDDKRADTHEQTYGQHMNAVNADLATHHDDRIRGQDMGLYGRVASAGLQPGPDGMRALSLSPEFSSNLGTFFASGKAPAASPVQATPPTAEGEVGLGKEYPAVVKELAGNKESVAKLRDIVAALHDPSLANPEDFGVTGDKINFHGVSPNTLGDLFGTEGSKRRAQLGQRINAPINEMLRRYGAALTNTELGRGIGEAGLQQALNGSFSPFATPLPIVQSSFKYLLDQAERELATNQQEVKTRTRKLEPTPKTSKAETPPVPAPDHKARVRAYIDANPGTSIEDAIKAVDEAEAGNIPY